MAQSWVSALQDFFKKDPYPQKVQITEFKSLNQQDKHDLREMLIAEGYDVLPIVERETESPA